MVQVVYATITHEPLRRKPKGQRPRRRRERIERAVCDAYIATVYSGKRLVRFYNSGEPLTGKIEH